MKSWAVVMAFLVFLGIGIASHFFHMRTYHEYSLKRLDMCLEHATGPDSSMVCSKIGSAADSAFSSAMANAQTTFFILINAFIVLGSWVFSLKKRLDKLENKTDA